MRLLVFSHDDAFIQELAPSGLFDLTRVEEINGEHSLSLTTTEKLEKQQRVLFEDSQSIWHEYVVMGEEQIHSDADEPMNTYYCVWSLQYDLMGLINKTMPGRDNPVTSTVALQHAIQNTERWTVGSVTQNTTSGCSMYYKSGWESLGLVVDNWGGEVTVTIEVDNTKVIARKVNLLNQQGSSEAVRRFDYSADLNQIKRTVDDAPYTCRITPRGQGEEGENGSFGRRITIESVNGGVEWLQDDDVVDLVRLPNGQGGYEYPNQIVIFEDIQDPQVLKDTALEHLHDYTRPRVTYEADVVQLQRAGLDAKGIALGDVVQVVDKTFKEDGLRVEGRVTQLQLDELDPTKNVVTIGFVPQGLEGQFSSMQASINEIQNWLDIETTPEYITGLIERINTEINATGGYTYLVEGVGIITYDKAVSDPSVGAEADQAVEVRGGSIRIANSKDAQGDWEWKTVFTAGHIAGELVTAAQITTGYIGSAGGTFIDLDNNTVQLGETTDVYTTLNNYAFNVYDKSQRVTLLGYANDPSTDEAIYAKQTYGSSATEGTSKTIAFSFENTLVEATLYANDMDGGTHAFPQTLTKVGNSYTWTVPSLSVDYPYWDGYLMVWVKTTTKIRAYSFGPRAYGEQTIFGQEGFSTPGGIAEGSYSLGLGGYAAGDHSVAIGSQSYTNTPYQIAVGRNDLASRGADTDPTKMLILASDRISNTSTSTTGGRIVAAFDWLGNLTLGGNKYSGDTSAQLSFRTLRYTSSIKAYDNGTTYGHDFVISPGSTFVAGAGEYADSRYGLGDIKDTEDAYLGADARVFIESNGNTIANRKTWQFTTGGTLQTPGDIQARYSTFDLSKENNNVSSTLYPTTFNILDSAGRIATRLEGRVFANGTMGAYWYVRNYNTSGTMVAQKGIIMDMNQSGNLTYTVNDNVNFKSAINAVGPEYIYNNTNGIQANNTATLTQNINLYKRLEILVSNDVSGTKKYTVATFVPYPNAATFTSNFVGMISTEGISGTTWQKAFLEIAINGTTLTLGNERYQNNGSTPGTAGSSKHIFVHRVVGYR